MPHVNKEPFECSVLVSTLTASSTTKPFLLPVRIQEDPHAQNPHIFSIHGKAFIDSGAMGNFIHPRLVEKFHIPTSTRDKTLHLQTVTGRKFFEVKEQVTILLTTKHGHEEVLKLDVAPIGKHNLILGLPWCTYHQVHFDWKQNDIISWSPDCEGRCFHAPRIVAPLLVQLLHNDAVLPTRKTTGAIGYDLTATENVTLLPGTRQCVGTGITIELPSGTYGRIAPRSGLAVKSSIDVAAGVIDPDYRGELKVVLVNNGQDIFRVVQGDRIAQLILENATLEDVQLTDQLTPTIRNNDGFGSTDMHDDLVDIYAITLGHTAKKDI